MAKALAYTWAPRLATSMACARARRRSQRLIRKWGLVDLNRRFVREAGDRVLDGPFRGLRLPAAAQREHVGPYLLGTYEAELAEWWPRLLKRQYAQVVDIGAKFGYYAVGLARHYRLAPVIAFDGDWWARRATGQVAAANGVTNITIHSLCSTEWFAAHLKDRALILSDCEGAERQLFGERWIPQFATATLVIELHEAYVPGVTEAIRRRFAASHVVHEVASAASRPVESTALSLTREEMQRVGKEIRGPQKWFVMEPRSA